MEENLVRQTGLEKQEKRISPDIMRSIILDSDRLHNNPKKPDISPARYHKRRVLDGVS
jgi:hypothetical protein